MPTGRKTPTQTKLKTVFSTRSVVCPAPIFSIAIPGEPVPLYSCCLYKQYDFWTKVLQCLGWGGSASRFKWTLSRRSGQEVKGVRAGTNLGTGVLPLPRRSGIHLVIPRTTLVWVPLVWAPWSGPPLVWAPPMSGSPWSAPPPGVDQPGLGPPGLGPLVWAPLVWPPWSGPPGLAPLVWLPWSGPPWSGSPWSGSPWFGPPGLGPLVCPPPPNTSLMTANQLPIIRSKTNLLYMALSASFLENDTWQIRLPQPSPPLQLDLCPVALSHTLCRQTVLSSSYNEVIMLEPRSILHSPWQLRSPATITGALYDVLSSASCPSIIA